MKYVFIVNPNSGYQKSKNELLEQLNVNKDNIDYEIYITKSKDDATHYVDRYCQNYSENVVFVACGGDGTISEVVNGMIDHPNAILACYPCGNGNDFVKVYGGKSAFLASNYLKNAKETKIDVMQINNRYSINVINYGFEVTVCDVANRIKRKKIIGGNNSYTTGILVAIFNSMKNYCKLYVDNNLMYEGNILLSTFANGKYVGGKYCCAPYSDNEDGLMEVTYVKPISIFKFLSLVKYYENGTHLKEDKFKSIIKYIQANKVTIDTKKDVKVCIDGEIYSNNHFEIINHKRKIRFLKPEN